MALLGNGHHPSVFVFVSHAICQGHKKNRPALEKTQHGTQAARPPPLGPSITITGSPHTGQTASPVGQKQHLRSGIPPLLAGAPSSSCWPRRGMLAGSCAHTDLVLALVTLLVRLRREERPTRCFAVFAYMEPLRWHGNWEGVQSTLHLQTGRLCLRKPGSFWIILEQRNGEPRATN